MSKPRYLTGWIVTIQITKLLRQLLWSCNNVWIWVNTVLQQDFTYRKSKMQSKSNYTFTWSTKTCNLSRSSLKTTKSACSKFSNLPTEQISIPLFSHEDQATSANNDYKSGEKRRKKATPTNIACCELGQKTAKRKFNFSCLHTTAGKEKRIPLEHPSVWDNAV